MALVATISRSADLSILGFHDLDRFLSIPLSRLLWGMLRYQTSWDCDSVVKQSSCQRKNDSKKSLSAVFDGVFGRFVERAWEWSDPGRIILRICVSISEITSLVRLEARSTVGIVTVVGGEYLWVSRTHFADTGTPTTQTDEHRSVENPARDHDP